MPQAHRPAVSPPRWVSRAPGRVNIIGEHIDYNDGWVLPMAIEQAVSITASPTSGSELVFRSRQFEDDVRIDLRRSGPQQTPPWGNYIQGVVWEFLEHTDVEIPGFHAFIESTVPTGSGLSSSAALEVAVATLLERVTGHELDPMEKARLCQRAEHTYAGMPCGIMDQAASALCREGHLLLLDCVSHTVRHVPFPADSVSVLIANTGVTHRLADGAYARRRRECTEALAVLGKASYREVTDADLDQSRLSELQRRRARHVVGEHTRTLAAVAALEGGDWSGLGTCLYGSHASLANDYEVSCPELDCLVTAARALGEEQGVIGARMTGGGFGGCTITLVHRPHLDKVRAHLAGAFQQHFDRTPDFYVSTPARGAY